MNRTPRRLAAAGSRVAGGLVEEGGGLVEEGGGLGEEGGGLGEEGGALGGSYRSTCLDNGVQVVTEAMDGVGSVATGVWVRQGAALDPAGLGGSAHLLEHLVFRGTRRRSRRQIAMALESLGGSLNAYTAREHTGFEARILSRHLPAAVEVLSDLVRRPLLREEDLEHEREVVFDEIAAVEDTPEDLVFELHADRMWGEHPYGKPILGTRDSVARIAREDLAALHRRTYTGANLVVAAAGDVEHDRFLELAHRWFGGIEAGKGAGAVGRPHSAIHGVDTIPRESAQLHIVLGHPTPGQSHPDRYALILLSSALGGGMSSRLFQRIREDLALAYSVYSYQSFYRRAGVCGSYLGTRAGCRPAALDAIREIYRKLGEEGLPGDELPRTREQVKGEILLSLESSVARVHRLAGFALAREPFIPVEDLPKRMDLVSQRDIMRVASEVMDPQRQYVLCLGPDEGESGRTGAARG